MAYADFVCYQDFFGGISIKDKENFQTFSERASEFLDMVTFDRLADSEMLKLHEDKVRKCVCELAELFFRRNIALSDGIPKAEDMPKTSERIGEYSVTTANPYDYVREISMTDEEFKKSLKSTVFRHLGNTGLLYRGAD